MSIALDKKPYSIESLFSGHYTYSNMEFLFTITVSWDENSDYHSYVVDWIDEPPLLESELVKIKIDIVQQFKKEQNDTK